MHPIRALGIVGVLAAALMGGTAVPVAAQSRYPVRDEQTITRTLRFDGSGDRTLDVRTVNGTIHVIAADVEQAQIDVRRTTRARSDSDVRDAERDVRLDFVDNALRVEAIVREAGGLVCGEPGNGRNNSWRPRYHVDFDFTIRVPRRTNLRLCGMNGDEIRVEGVDGTFDITHLNGGIRLDNVRGSGSAETLNGPLVVSFAESPRAASWFKTLNGEIDATFPAALSADVTLKTRNGELLTDFDTQTLPLPAASTQRRNGMFVYRSSGTARVRIGRGGPEISLETMNGDVRLLRASR
jgi:DUF4097 and DUF4098 domain-containing protein YvlB